MADNINQSISDLTTALNAATLGLAECCQLKGGVVNPSESDGDIQTGPDEQFPDQESYFNAKCSASNGIYDTVRGLIDWLHDNNAEMIIGSFGGITAAISLGLLFAGPVGWAAIAAETTLVGLSSWAFSTLFDFDDMQDAFDDVKDELVMSLYNASDSVVARTSFLAVLDTATPALTTAEKRLVQYTLSSAVLNQLFSPRADVAVYTSPSPTDCGVTLALWTFPTDEEGFTFRDDSEGASSASGDYESDEEALEITMVNAGGGSRPLSKGTWVKTGLSIAIPAGSAARFDFSAPSDSITQAIYLKVIYSDLTDDEKSMSGGTKAGTIVLTLPTAKTISDIECSIGRTTSLSNTHTSNIEEVRVQ
ncbi:MAG: hypothetical protein KAS66_12760 [Candidatus Omnitrophica bacterium]|nr:hypothetical protein [Candidatus Omnitrophota bacterium]